MTVYREMNRNLHRAGLFAAFVVLGCLSAAGQSDKKTSPVPPPRPARVPTARAQGTAPRNPAHAASNRVNEPNRNTIRNRSTIPNRTSIPNTTENNRAGNHPNGRRSPDVIPNNRGRTGPDVSHSQMPAGRTVSLRAGGTATLRSSGQLRSIDRGGLHIEYGMRGSRTTSSVRNGSRIVTSGTNGHVHGYVQRAYAVRSGHTYVQRTYVVNNVTRTAAYRTYYYGGAYYYSYAPAFYYHPAFYGWVYNPWPAPVYWGWGWARNPWYDYYGYYFAPYPVYPSAAFWLTDYLIASSLQAAYAARTEAEYQQDAGVAGNQPSGSNNNNTQPSQETVTLTPEVKQAIVEEVKAQVAAEQAAANQQGAPSGGGAAFASDAGVPPALDPARRTFVVFSEIDVVADNTECTLTPGDVITRLTDKPNQDQNVTASVTTSKQSDCAPGKQVAVSVTDLQEMQNRFREQLDGGLKELAQKQGSAGLPNAPDTMTVAGDVPPPPVDTTAAKALQDQQAAADQTSTEVKRETSGQGS